MKKRMTPEQEAQLARLSPTSRAVLDFIVDRIIMPPVRLYLLIRHPSRIVAIFKGAQAIHAQRQGIKANDDKLAAEGERMLKAAGLIEK